MKGSEPAGKWMDEAERLTAERDRLFAAIIEHHSQKADDRCVEDDDRLYAAGLPPCDRRVGSKEEMLANCTRFIERRCEGGGWPSYRELEQRLATAESNRLAALSVMEASDVLLQRLRNRVKELERENDLLRRVMG